jgi:DNA (cytosine-5)-methyltransferase 1
VDDLTFGSLFAGIGGIDLGLERAGWTGRWQVEWDAYCQRVLAKHWPDVPRLGDVHDAHGAAFCPVADADSGRRDGRSGELGEGWRPEPSDGCGNCLPYVDLIAGGFPCQPFSNAGKRKGKDDDRWLWPEFARVVGELRPSYVLVENVPGLLAGHGGMGAVLGDLAELGYDAEWDSVPAAAVGAPHLRYRVWIVAYARSLGRGREAALGPSSLTGTRSQDAGPEPHGAGDGEVAHADVQGLEGRPVQPERPGERPARTGGVADPEGAERGGPELQGMATPGWGAAEPRERIGLFGPGDYRWLPEPDVGRVAHGVPARVDRLRALGNAVVPQVVEAIGRRIIEAESLR